MSGNAELTPVTGRSDNIVVRSGPAPPKGAPAADDLTEADFDALLKDVLENPDLLEGGALTDEQILELHKRLNPYAGIGGPAPSAEKVRAVACSFTNLTEDYLRRLTMTSLAGFLFQLGHEWEAPAEARAYIPEAARKRIANDKADQYKPLDLGGLRRLHERVQGVAGVVEEAIKAAVAAAEAQDRAVEANAAVGAGSSDAERAAADAADRARDGAAERAAGLLYAATYAAAGVGAAVEDRLRATAEAGRRWPQVREIIKDSPLPPPPGQVTIPSAKVRELIQGFLRHWLCFDPSVHVRSGYNEKAVADAVEAAQVEAAAGGGRPIATQADAKDPRRWPVSVLRGKAPRPKDPAVRAQVEKLMETQANLNAATHLLHQAEADPAYVAAVQAALAGAAEYAEYLAPVPADSPARPALDVVPPQDTFHRWAYYAEVNYDTLRRITEALYPERPDLDWMLGLWQYFEGPEKEVKEAFDAHCQRYQDEVPSAIKMLTFGGWSVLADFAKNRENISFYNKNTDVIKRIIDRHADDKRIGGELMKNRIRQEKAKNIREEGPDAPGLAAYRRALAQGGQAVEGKGAQKVISAAEMRRLELARGNVKAAQELEAMEEYEATVARLERLERERRLNAMEEEELAATRRRLEQARQMLVVPEDAIQVDTFVHDTATGEFRQDKFYTAAVAPDSAPDAAAIAAAAAAGAANTDHPLAKASFSSAASAAMVAANSHAAAQQAPVMARFAVESMERYNKAISDGRPHEEAIKAAAVTYQVPAPAAEAASGAS